MNEPTPKLILIDVSNPYREAFAVWARRQQVEIVTCAADTWMPGPPSNALLCVIETANAALLNVGPVLKAMTALPIVVLAHEINGETTVRLLRAGIRDVVDLPAPATDVVAKATVSVMDLAAGAGERELIGRSVAMRQLRREIEAVAPMDSYVLITGETGTGKGLAARLLHDLSGRRKQPFVHVNCGALAASVIESELFGHERGAFTGAAQEHAGRFEMAGNGTIFLDEIAELDASLQAKLLRGVEERAYERVGGSKTRMMTARVLAATNRDIDGEVRAGRFRADLLYRLNVFQLILPPLRDRPEDLPSLVRSGLERLARRLQLSPPALSDSAYARLASHDWPGNVRELMNLLERLLIRHHSGLFDEADLSDLLGPPSRARSRSDADRPSELPHCGSDEERVLLEAELAAAGGNISRVARRLGLARSTLRYRLALHDLESLIPHD